MNIIDSVNNIGQTILFFSNEYFLAGIFIAFLARFLYLFSSELKNATKEDFLYSIGGIFLATMFLAFDRGSGNIIVDILIVLILAITLYSIRFEFKSRGKHDLFPKINLNSFMIPTFFLVFLFFSASIFVYSGMFVIFSILIYLSRNFSNIIKIIFYNIYLILFIVTFFILNLSVVEYSQNYLTEFFANNFGIFLFGIVIGYLFFSVAIYLSYFNGLTSKHQSKEKVKQRRELVLDKFKENIKITYSYTFLSLLLIIFLINSLISIPIFGIFIVLFLLNELIFKLTNN